MKLPRIAIYGMGRFGRSLAEALAVHGPDAVCVGSRREAPVGESLPWNTGADAFVSSLHAEDLVVIAVPDDVIAPVATEFANAGLKGARVVHPSGALGRDVLGALADAGCDTGVFHVLQSFPAKGGADRFSGSHCGIDASDELADVLTQLAKLLEMTPFILPPDRSAYHAAAVLASNAMVAMLDTGRQILEGAGVPPDKAAKILLPLVRGTLSNIEDGSSEQALTGPIVRGDTKTVASHLATLTGSQRETYLSCMRAVLRIAEKSGRTGKEQLDELRRLLN